jgi:outer membrane protein TolC
MVNEKLIRVILIHTRMHLLVKRDPSQPARLHQGLAMAACIAALLLLPPGSAAQIQGMGPSTGAARATQLPLSGRPAENGVQVEQTANDGSSANTLNTRISVSGNTSGSVLDPGASRSPITLTVEDAIRRGLAFNLGRVAADISTRAAQAQRAAVRSSLLPQINASLSENAAKINLAAEGFSANTFGNSFGFAFPTTVGPFHYYDLHGSLQQDAFDFTAIHNLRSARQAEDAAGLNAKDAREQVVLAVAGTYLQLLATSALIEEQQVEVQYAEASYKQAQAQADAGNKAPIEATRSLVEFQIEKQRLSSENGDFLKQKNALSRLIGLPLGVEITLAEKLPTSTPAAPELDAAIRTAFAQRQDLRSAEAQLRAAEEARKAAGAERLPTASISGTYGLQGTDPDGGTNVFQASATVALPIFQGGRIHADIAQADAVVDQRRAELSDQRGAVELDVRNAYIDLQVATEQVATAASNRKLALQTLQQSQDRFAVGVADSVEVVSSEQSLASADHDYVSSRFSESVARITLARAIGEAEKDLPDLLKGSL